MWVIWVHSYYIKAKIVWDTCPKSASWGYPKDLQGKALPRSNRIYHGRCSTDGGILY